MHQPNSTSCSQTQAWISSHIWTPKSRRLAATDQIFGCRKYNILNISVQLVPSPDILLQKSQYPEYFGSYSAYIIILFAQDVLLQLTSGRAEHDLEQTKRWWEEVEEVWFQNKAFQVIYTVHPFFLTMNKLYNLVFSEMRGRPDDDEEPEKKPRRKISAWWDFKLDDN